MKPNFLVLTIVVGVGIAAGAGCHHPAGSSQGCSTQSYAPTNSAPVYNQGYGQTYDQGSSFGSGSRSAPSQGSGSR